MKLLLTLMALCITLSAAADPLVQRGRYLVQTGGCNTCHSPSGDLKGIGTRIPDAKNLQHAWLMPPRESTQTSWLGSVGSGTVATHAAPVQTAPQTETPQKVEGGACPGHGVGPWSGDVAPDVSATDASDSVAGGPSGTHVDDRS